MTHNLITRNEYMDNSTELHQDYYAQFATEATRGFILSNIGLDKLKQSKDSCFNDIIKHSNGGAGGWIWDRAPYDHSKMIEAGECSEKYKPSLSTITCTAKACARQLLKEANQ